jgi:hypothetical protein
MWELVQLNRSLTINWPFIDTHLLENLNYLTYLLNIFIYLYGFSSGPGSISPLSCPSYEHALREC